MSFKSSQRGISALPLHTVPVVVLDSETTGLNTTTDRMIELAAVRIRDSLIQEDTFESFVNPGMPIPARSTEIHGIKDGDVADAADFPSVMADFADWTDHDVVVGYSIGFDLGIMASEHERADIHWTAPRTVDVRHLIKLCNPNLPQDSLEVAAEWLGVHITGRHRALGDAQATADIFLALLPKLRDKGITTLAQAERACARLAERLTEEAQAGWHDVAERGRQGPRSVYEYARIDSYAYRHLVGDVMHSPPETVPDGMPLKDALNKMATRKISSVFVLPEGDGDIGILTERDVLRAVDTHGADALGMTVDAFAARPLVTIPSDEFVYRAITRMSRGNFRHLGVTDPEGELAGALSARDLLKQRAGDAMSLGETIDAAASPLELGRVWADLTMVVRGLVFEEVDPRDIAAIVSREMRALTRRACQLGEMQMEADGHGSVPAPYAMLVLGSGGRGESLLAMDQDNAIIYADDAPPEADAWFTRLGEYVADTLNDAGVIYCPGGIMAKNDAWRKDQSAWRDTVAGWIGGARPEDLLNTDIFFDAVPVHGDHDLGEGLRGAAMAAAKDSSNFIQVMTRKAAEFSSPIGMFGRIKKDDEGRVDLKLSGIMPIFAAARVLALTHGIAARSTPARLEAARELDVSGAKHIDNVTEAHRILLGAILRQQLRDLETGIALSNRVALSELDAHEHQELKWALEQNEVINDLMGAPAQF